MPGIKEFLRPKNVWMPSLKGLGRHSPIDREDGAGRVAGGVAGEIEGGADDLVWFADAAQGEALRTLVERVPVPCLSSRRCESPLA